MSEQFLHHQLTNVFNFGIPKQAIPETITQNRNPILIFSPLCREGKRVNH